MQCPYCNVPNSERATFCSRCGRDLVQAVGTVQPSQQPQPTRTTQPYSPPSPYPQRPPAQSAQSTPHATSQPAYPAQPQSTRSPQARPAALPATQSTRPTPLTRVAETVKVPDAPAPFPPRTLEQLQALEQGALAYTVIDEVIGNGRHRTIRISYRSCSAWQQIATLLKAFKEQQSDKFDTIIVQGIVTNTALPYAFNNGQFRYDHNVRLGSQFINRYVIETGTGLESDSLRIVLQDPGAQ